MKLPYEDATAGERLLQEIQKILRALGCTKIGNMVDHEAGMLLIQFEYRERQVSVKASIKGYASAWLRAHPNGTHLRAQKVASKAVYSILRDWIKGQVMAVETGVLSFEGAFLGQILLPSGRTVLETVEHDKLLPAPPTLVKVK